MKKEIKKYGSSKVIVLTNEECKIYGTKEKQLEVGDFVDIEIVPMRKSEKEWIREANHQTGASFGISE